MIFVHLECIESFEYFLNGEENGDYSFNVVPVASRMKGLCRFLYKFLSSRKVFRLLPCLPRKWLCRFLIDKKTFAQIKNQDNVCFIVHGYTDLTPHYCDYLKRAFPKSKRVIVFEDKIKHYCDNYQSFDIKKVQDSFDCALTYNSLDSKKYGMATYPPIIPKFPLLDPFHDSKEIDVFFVGRDKGRLSRIIEVYDVLRTNNLSCEFHLIGVKKKKRIIREGVFYHNKPIPYSFVLDKIRNAKAILNVMQEGAEGITLRDLEAVSLNKLLITNCKDIANYGFYSKEKVIYIEDIHFLDKNVLSEKEKLFWKDVESYNISNYYRAIKDDLGKRDFD